LSRQGESHDRDACARQHIFDSVVVRWFILLLPSAGIGYCLSFDGGLLRLRFAPSRVVYGGSLFFCHPIMARASQGGSMVLLFDCHAALWKKPFSNPTLH
jgi:hypothetical protein